MMRIKKLSVLFLLLILLVPAVTVNVCAEEPQAESTEEPQAEIAELPPWFPEDPHNFDVVYDEFAPRVVDEADIFTDDEEFEMESLLFDIRQEFERDIVIYTDTTSYGMERKMVAADFFGFNSYGCGSDREGACLFICMDPENRGFWTACHGPDTMGLYNYSNSSTMDGALQRRLKAGEYGEGVLEWLGYFRTLYQKGMPIVPDWYPDRDKWPERFHDPDAPRVVDDAHIFTEAQRLELEDQARKIADKYGKDIVIWAFQDSINLSCVDAFIALNGYGLGENYDGFILLECYMGKPEWGSSRFAEAFGDWQWELNPEKHMHLSQSLIRMYDLMEEGSDDFKAANIFLKYTDHYLRTGRVPHKFSYWLLISAAGALGGTLIGGIALIRAKLRMAVPKLRKNADAYIVPGSFDMKKLGDTYLYSSYSTRYDPVSSRSSGGDSDSDSGSSYDSGYTADDGDTYSGSGRDF